MTMYNIDRHRNASYRWRGIDTDKTYKDLKPKNRNTRSCFDWHERTKKELAKMRKEDVKIRKQIKARENLIKKMNKANLSSMAKEYIEWLDNRKCSNNWKKTR